MGREGMNYFKTLVIVDIDGIAQMLPKNFMERVSLYEKGMRNLMIAVLDVNIKDYMNTFRRKRLKNKGQQQARELRNWKAKSYIFNDGQESEGYVFGFKFICKYLGLDPERMRNKIKEIKTEKDVARIIRLKDAVEPKRGEGYFL